jgi:hypothetical protein
MAPSQRRLLVELPLLRPGGLRADPAEAKRVFTGDPTIVHAGEANPLALGDVLGDHSLS